MVTTEPGSPTGGPAPSGGTAALRRVNLGRVVEALRAGGPATRVELARATDLTKVTTGEIVADLVARGVVTEEVQRQGGRGRPGRAVRLVGERFLAVGLELNVDFVSAVVLDLAGEVVLETTRAVAGDPGDPGDRGDRGVGIGALRVLVGEVGQRFPARDHAVVGVGVAVPGLVLGERRVVWSPNTDAERADLPALVESALGRPCPVMVGNDANYAAWAEVRRGCAVGAQEVVYLTGTVGVGAGVVSGGRLVRGAGGFAGEVGHLPLGEPGARCGCGRTGCWEASVGLKALLSAVGLPELDDPLSSAHQVAALAARDDAVAEEVRRHGARVGRGLAVLAHVLDPGTIVLGGCFAPIGELVVPAAAAVLGDSLVPAVRPRPVLRVSSLGMRAAALGAAEVALGSIYDGSVALEDGARRTLPRGASSGRPTT